MAAKKITKKPSRLYQKATILSFKRARKSLYQNEVLVKINDVNTTNDAAFYYGKKVAYVYKCKRVTNGSRFRVLWGKVRRAHGHNGVVRAAFRKNLPCIAFGAPARVMLYPSSI